MDAATVAPLLALPLRATAWTRGEVCGLAAKEGRNHCSRVALSMATKTTQ